jgi:hypothetical protein
MSIRIRVSCGRKISTKKGNGEPTFGSYCAGTSISFSLEDDLIKTPEVFVAKVREFRAIARAAMYDELSILATEANGHATTPKQLPTTAPPPAAAARPPTVSGGRPRPNVAEVAVEMKEYVGGDEFDEFDSAQEEEDDDPPTDGKHLLGWARNQPGDAKGWLIGLGKKLRYPNKILDWTPRQVDTAYQAYKKQQRSKR